MGAAALTLRASPLFNNGRVLAVDAVPFPALAICMHNANAFAIIAGDVAVAVLSFTSQV